MANRQYKEKLEAYITSKEKNSRDIDSARGLLAPKNVTAVKQEVKQQLTAVESVAEFMYAIRQKRKEIVNNRKAKNGT